MIVLKIDNSTKTDNTMVKLNLYFLSYYKHKNFTEPLCFVLKITMCLVFYILQIYQTYNIDFFHLIGWMDFLTRNLNVLKGRQLLQCSPKVISLRRFRLLNMTHCLPVQLNFGVNFYNSFTTLPYIYSFKVKNNVYKGKYNR